MTANKMSNIGNIEDIINNIDDVIWSLSLPDHKTLFISNSAEKLYEIPQGDILKDKKYWERKHFLPEANSLGRIMDISRMEIFLKEFMAFIEQNQLDYLQVEVNALARDFEELDLDSVGTKLKKLVGSINKLSDKKWV